VSDITALRADLLVAEAAFTAASKDAQDAQARFYAAALSRDRARAAVRVAEREAVA
jgi:hypothetical protein